MTMEIVWL